MYFACELFDYQPVLQKIVLVIVHRLKGVSINDRTQLAVRPQVCPLYLFVCYLRTVPWEYQHISTADSREELTPVTLITSKNCIIFCHV